MMQAIAAVMVHVSDVAAGLAWYQRAFPQAVRQQVEGFDFEVLAIGGVTIEIVQADEKVSSGAAGSVVYWNVLDLPSALARMQSVGAVLYRGPMPIEDGLAMCQVRDPWGNCIGLRGPG
ncbi:glyoxalase/bleomycin resistance/dioxygenase family protein [soil metagenome]